MMEVVAMIPASGLALLLGAIMSRLHVLGLALLLAVVAGAVMARTVWGLTHPTLIEAIFLLALMQAGYVAAALTRGEPGNPDAQGSVAHPPRATGGMGHLATGDKARRG